MKVFIILPTQLFKLKKSLFSEIDRIILWEHSQYFTVYPYHKQKLLLHRASMKNYQKYIVKTFPKIDVKYIDFNKHVEINKNAQLFLFNPIDKCIIQELKKYNPIYLESPSFLETIEDISVLKGYKHSEFYKWQRKRLNILITNENKPEGGRWSFDTENRKSASKLKKEKGFEFTILKQNKSKSIQDILRKAIKYVETNFPNNYGDVSNFNFPVTSKDAEKQLHNFCKNQLRYFGEYEDAISHSMIYGFHSVLSSSMNIGILTPEIVLKIVLQYNDKIPLNSLEGFIRQVIGWRSYVRYVYFHNSEYMFNTNYLNHHNKMNNKWWNGDTSLTILDDTIKKVIKYSYAHHIERLMILGNYMLLCMIHPKEVYDWFMTLFIDAYEWVMVPNVFGMSQYADGGLVMTRPYFCSSNYLKKMSDFDSKYINIWKNQTDCLYYNFIVEHQITLKKIYSTASAVKILKKKSESEIKEIRKKANSLIKELIKS